MADGTNGPWFSPTLMDLAKEHLQMNEISRRFNLKGEELPPAPQEDEVCPCCGRPE